MKPLFDQNLSHRLCRLLVDLWPVAAQVRSAGLDRASDAEIWSFAQREGFVIVTLDADFADIAALRGAPPKVIWLRCGNQPTHEVERFCGAMRPLLQGSSVITKRLVSNSTDHAVTG